LRIALAAAVAWAAVAAADAHVRLDYAAPAAGSAARRLPREVTLWFTEKVEPAFSTVTVTNAAGNRVDDGKIAVDPHNAQELHVALQPLAPGVYEVHRHRLAADKHQTQGQFSFIVASD
jgi:copper resistance protein C